MILFLYHYPHIPVVAIGFLSCKLQKPLLDRLNGKGIHQRIWDCIQKAQETRLEDHNARPNAPVTPQMALSKPHLWKQILQLNHHTENQRVLPEPLIFPSLRKKTYLPFSSLEWFYAAPAFCFTSCQFKISKASIWLVQLGSHTYILAAREAGNASSWLVPWEELTNGSGSLKVESSQKRNQKSILPAINNFNN